jgi:hypothetical protein
MNNEQGVTVSLLGVVPLREECFLVGGCHLVSVADGWPPLT